MSLDIMLKNHNTLKCPHCGEITSLGEDETVFDCNITHNLSKMADVANINGATWDAWGKKCKDVVKELEDGIKDMKARPEYYRQFDADNGWGTYDDFMPWLNKLLIAYKEFPEATIYTSS